MGLIKAGLGALGGVLADQWKEFFYCDSMDMDTLVVKGQKRTGSRSSNTKGSDNIISNGSGIAVADGQCMLIVEQGRVVEVCAEPGEFTYNSSTEPSIFTGNLGDSIKESFKTLGRRFTYGGDTGKDQRVYYVNTKEIMDNKFGTSTPIPFRVVDSRVELDMDTEIRCNGVYSYKIADPIIFYTKICANVAQRFERDQIDAQLKTEFVDALSPAFGELSSLELRPNEIPKHTKELRNYVNDALKDLWLEARGLCVVSIAMNPVSLTPEDAAYLKQFQRADAVDRRPGIGTARYLEQVGEALGDAAKNPNGGASGFVGVGVGMGVGGVGSPTQFMGAMGQSQQKPAQPAADTWTCSCGTVASGKFCPECGNPKPVAEEWTCSCGAVNKGKFCPNCGKPKPAGAPSYRCSNCGWEPEDPTVRPKFCPECGDPFDEKDVK